MFKRTFPFLLVACLVTSTLWAGDSSFVGDWKLNPSKSKTTDVMKVSNLGPNKYGFDFGSGSPEAISIDGTDQPGIFGTTLSVAPAGPDGWTVVRKKDGHMLLTASWKLSKDSKTLTDDYTEFAPNGSSSTTHYLYARTAGTSGFAGTWESTMEPGNAYVLQVRTYEGEGLSFIDPTGKNAKNVKFDGKDYPNVGPNQAPGATSSIRRLDQHTLEMTNKVNGKILQTEDIELSSDLKSMTMTVHVASRTKPDIFVFERQ